MELFYRDFGGASTTPLLLLHGLLGSSRNWVTVGKLLSTHHHVIALDLRNHGSSPHADPMDYPSMADDVLQWMDQQGVERADVVGHSMGGKTAMWLACTHPERVRTLTIADIAPKPYPPHFHRAFEAMHEVDPNQYRRISEVEQALAAFLEDPVLRQFLVTNLVRNHQGTFDWQINLSGITRALAVLSGNPLDASMRYEGPSLLLHGENSDFVDLEDHALMRSHFPQCRILEVPSAGHNVHVENRAFFAEQVAALIPQSRTS